MAHAGARLHAAADLTGDGVADWLVAAPDAEATVVVLHGTDLSERARIAGEVAGIGIGSCADADGDGQPEVALGRPDADEGRGGVSLLSAPLDGDVDGSAAALIGSSASSGARAGWVVDCADLDGDGLSDLAVGAPDQDGFGQGVGSGAVGLYSGVDGALPALTATYTTTFADAALGTDPALSVQHDLDGDGVRDLLAGAPGVHRLFAAPGPFLGSADNTSTGWVWDGEVGSRFGAAFSLDDWNQDGHLDLLVGGPAWHNDRGSLWHVSGPLDAAAAGHVDAPFAEGDTAGDLVGTALAAPGDMTGDGLVDALVGAPGVDEGAGAVYVLDAFEDRPMALAAAVIAGSGRFGASLAARPGSALVGAPDDDQGGVALFVAPLGGTLSADAAAARWSF